MAEFIHAINLRWEHLTARLKQHLAEAGELIERFPDLKNAPEPENVLELETALEWLPKPINLHLIPAGKMTHSKIGNRMVIDVATDLGDTMIAITIGDRESLRQLIDKEAWPAEWRPELRVITPTSVGKGIIHLTRGGAEALWGLIASID
jgi:hypothetical protein